MALSDPQNLLVGTTVVLNSGGTNHELDIISRLGSETNAQEVDDTNGKVYSLRVSHQRTSKKRIRHYYGITLTKRAFADPYSGINTDKSMTCYVVLDAEDDGSFTQAEQAAWIADVLNDAMISRTGIVESQL